MVGPDPCPAVRYTGLTYFENVGRGTYTIYAYKRSVSTTTESRCCRNRVTSLYDRPPTRYSFMILYRLARDVTSVTCTGTRGAPVEPSVAVRHASTNTHHAWRLSVTAAGYIRRSCCMTSHASVADDLVRNVYCALTSVK